MANLDTSELEAFIYHAQAQGCEIFRVGAQTDGWAGHAALYLDAAAGPTVFSQEWEDNLRRLLDVTARIDGVYLQLIPTFTHKHESAARNMEITKRVVAIWREGEYKHVVWEAVNEWKHPISTLNMSDVANLLLELRKTGLPVGTDCSMGSKKGRYPEMLLPLVDYVAFHPARYRRDDGRCQLIRPNYDAIRATVRRYPNKPVWFDEPICYISDDSKRRYNIGEHGHYALCGSGTEAKRKKVIVDYMWDVEQAGGIWFTHALWLFECRYLGWLAQ
jgi:hypothetical protein